VGVVELVVCPYIIINGQKLSQSQYNAIVVLHAHNDWHCVLGLIKKLFSGNPLRDLYTACFNGLQEWGYIDMRYMPNANPWGEKVKLTAQQSRSKYANYYVKLSDGGQAMHGYMLAEAKEQEKKLAKKQAAEAVAAAQEARKPYKKPYAVKPVEGMNLYWVYLHLIQELEGGLHGYARYMGTKVHIEQDSLARQARGDGFMIGNAKEYYSRLKARLGK
jgi:hypothetical protein